MMGKRGSETLRRDLAGTVTSQSSLHCSTRPFTNLLPWLRVNLQSASLIALLEACIIKLEAQAHSSDQPQHSALPRSKHMSRLRVSAHASAQSCMVHCTPRLPWKQSEGSKPTGPLSLLARRVWSTDKRFDALSI
eukprot:2552547-Rhodomonas_salina.1